MDVTATSCGGNMTKVLFDEVYREMREALKAPIVGLKVKTSVS